MYKKYDSRTRLRCASFVLNFDNFREKSKNGRHDAGDSRADSRDLMPMYKELLKIVGFIMIFVAKMTAVFMKYDLKSVIVDDGP